MNSPTAFVKNIPDLVALVREFKKSNNKVAEARKYISKELIYTYAQDDRFIRESKKFLRKYFKGYSDVRWHILYAALSGIKSPEYIPYDLWITLIEPQLNPPDMAKAYCDKNIYDKIFNYRYLPKTIARIYNNTICDPHYNPISLHEFYKKIENQSSKIVMKPTFLENSGRGRNVKILQNSEIKNIITTIPKNENWIFQEYIEQHDEMAQYHPGSINTLRVMTINISGEYRLLTTILRVGVNDTNVDNIGAGGIYVGVYSDGYLRSFGLDKNYTKYYNHPNTNIKFGGKKIPDFDKVIALVTQLHRYLYNFKVVSWDIAIMQNAEPLVIEYNLYEVIIRQQFCNGPLLSPYTHDILSQINRPHYFNIGISKLLDIHRNVSFLKMKR